MSTSSCQKPPLQVLSVYEKLGQEVVAYPGSHLSDPEREGASAQINSITANYKEELLRMKEVYEESQKTMMNQIQRLNPKPGRSNTLASDI